MERTRKSSKKVEQKVDRLSDLPDGVLCHILSFLETKRSVQTSVLAKRWMTLWAHVPALAFQFDYANPKRATFPGMVCAFLLRQKVESLTTFRLTYTGGDDVDDGPSLGCYEHASCVATAVERNVRNLHLRGLCVEVPRCALTCETLIDLTMEGDVRIPPSALISLPNLKKLHLRNLKCKVDLTRLISGCPVIEELIIAETTCRDPKGCCISSPTLKRLTLRVLLDRSMFNNPDYVVTINTPALRYLQMWDVSFKHVSISLCTNLVEANICIYYLDEIHQRCLLKSLERICNVKSLQLTLISWDDRLISYDSIPKFGNLTKLELFATWCLLTKFLEAAHHLQVLTITEVESQSKDWMEPAIEERCACPLLHSLRTVGICGFRCKEPGFNMVRYILRNARVLERMEIDCQQWPRSVGLKAKYDAIQRISLFRRDLRNVSWPFLEI